MDWIPVESRAISRMAFNPARETIIVEFQNGTQAEYEGCSKDLFAAGVNSDSVGQWWHRTLKGKVGRKVSYA